MPDEKEDDLDLLDEQQAGNRTRSHFHRQLSGWVFVDQPPIATPGVPPSQDGVDLWVIQNNPPDYPNKYVVRHWLITDEDRWVDDQPLGVADTLAAARQIIQPRQRVNIGRYEDPNDPSVCEAWM